MEKRLLLILLVLTALFATTAHAAQSAQYSVVSHVIDIEVKADESTTIVERFYLFFPSDKDKIDFRVKSQEYGSDSDKWKAYNVLFQPSVGNNNIANGKISYTEGDQSYLEISYSLRESLMAKGKETAMMLEYSIKSTFLDTYYQSGVWVIPDNTKIIITLPAGAEIRDAVEPLASISTLGSKKIVTWDGYKSGNRLTLDYIVWKKISPAIDVSAILNFLFRTREGLIIIGICAIILAITIVKRKEIQKRIETFVETHTRIEEE